MGAGGKRHVLANLPLGMTRHPWYRRLGGPQGQFGRVRKISPLPGFDPLTAQPIANCYTDNAIPAICNTDSNEQPYKQQSWILIICFL
jgi:hypothetical protein